ncbi:unnamed protein product [Periconia digitata]|uniref:Uncharacterized protein n=1 Tax=Periconia digitata TaxID=1303443 RepID=A0A9W4XNK3_9PLEO|nr:unnamed protein product [Periconia digitata]
MWTCAEEFPHRLSVSLGSVGSAGSFSLGPVWFLSSGSGLLFFSESVGITSSDSFGSSSLGSGESCSGSEVPSGVSDTVDMVCAIVGVSCY